MIRVRNTIIANWTWTAYGFACLDAEVDSRYRSGCESYYLASEGESVTRDG